MRKQRCLLLTDAKGAAKAVEVQEELARESLPVEVVNLDVHPLSDQAIADLFSRQTIGTFLYLYTGWDRLDGLLELAEEAGFSAEEMACQGFGPRIKRIFCSACQHYNLARLEPVIHCSACGEELEISTHYSRRHRAFLGYTSIK